MGYFPNSTSWEYWAVDNCFKCAHWPKTDDDAPCPVEMAHMLYNYEQGDDGEECKVRTIFDMLIPRDGIENKRCAMFKDRDGLTARHLRDWAKYKALMAERDAAIAMPCGHEDAKRLSPEGVAARARRASPETSPHSSNTPEIEE